MAYVAQAAEDLKKAAALESEGNYQDSLAHYIQAISILLQGSQADPDEKRRTHVQRKLLDYMARADLVKQRCNSVSNQPPTPAKQPSPQPIRKASPQPSAFSVGNSSISQHSNNNDNMAAFDPLFPTNPKKPDQTSFRTLTSILPPCSVPVSPPAAAEGTKGCKSTASPSENGKSKSAIFFGRAKSSISNPDNNEGSNTVKGKSPDSTVSTSVTPEKSRSKSSITSPATKPESFLRGLFRFGSSIKSAPVSEAIAAPPNEAPQLPQTRPYFTPESQPAKDVVGAFDSTTTLENAELEEANEAADEPIPLLDSATPAAEAMHDEDVPEFGSEEMTQKTQHFATYMQGEAARAQSQVQELGDAVLGRVNHEGLEEEFQELVGPQQQLHNTARC